MNKLIFKAVPILVFELTVQTIFAQGTLYVSNLSERNAGSLKAASDSWIAQEIFTGSNSGGYTLDSVQLLMDAASRNPNGFSVSLYDNSAVTPSSDLGTLVGANPAAGGVFTYMASNLTLLPETIYFIVVTAITPVSQGAYEWSFTDEDLDSGNDGWSIGGGYDTSPDGLNWNFYRGNLFQIGIYATPVPEPSAWALVLLGGGVLICVRTRKHLSA